MKLTTLSLDVLTKSAKNIGYLCLSLVAAIEVANASGSREIDAALQPELPIEIAEVWADYQRAGVKQIVAELVSRENPELERESRQHELLCERYSSAMMAGLVGTCTELREARRFS